MKSALRKIGNSQGVIIPQPLISQLNLGPEVELTVEKESIVIRKTRRRVRLGWQAAASKLSEHGDDRAVWPAFENVGDQQLRW